MGAAFRMGSLDGVVDEVVIGLDVVIVVDGVVAGDGADVDEGVDADEDEDDAVSVVVVELAFSALLIDDSGAGPSISFSFSSDEIESTRPPSVKSVSLDSFPMALKVSSILSILGFVVVSTGFTSSAFREGRKFFYPLILF